MASWYNNLISKTSSGIRGFLQSESDGDTEDDTHVCRVLRSYYTEKGRPFPGWLPPDPRSPQPVAPTYTNPAVGSRYGGLSSTTQGSAAAAGGFSSLWDTPSSNGTSQPQSLRQGGGRPAFGAQSSARNSPFSPGQQAQPQDARPAPQKGYSRDGAASAASGGSSAQDRLKQRLWGGSRTASPQAAGGGPFQPPPQQQQQAPSRGDGGGSGYNSYGQNGGGGGGYQQQQDYGGGARRQPMGLPSGPRGGGLPSGPRMRG
ncbi:hypothetical protein TD95_003418 [Thielaviopsis punctulata]|uniref:Mso1 N-terminal domain-containing protein n=1 Tax=Thielaviopsis punctulata TaxID=72032 RepID=A0A0F4Z9M0_9PEZI|nr:hypothetical protein TD95_003418 [Thielaviopsis punctulata]